MRPDRLTLILDWLKENKADAEGGTIPIPTRFREDVIEIVGVNESFKEELDHNLIHKHFLYQRILLNKDFAFKLQEKYWWEQFQFVQNQKIYFNNIKNKDIDPTESTDFQINEKIRAREKLEYLNSLSVHLELKMKQSNFWMNHLTYLLG